MYSCTPGGIGSALALAAHNKGKMHLLCLSHYSRILTGFRVFATGRVIAKLDPLASKGIEILELDVSNHESIQSLKNEISKRTDGRLDILVNNA